MSKADGFETDAEAQENLENKEVNDASFMNASFDDDNDDDEDDDNDEFQTAKDLSAFTLPDAEKTDDKSGEGKGKINFEDKETEEKEEEEETDDDDDDDSEDFSEKELEKLNKKLGTNFKGKEDLKKSLQIEETQDERVAEQTEIQKSENTLKAISSYLEKSDEDLVRIDLTHQASVKKLDITDPKVIQDIEDKIDALKDIEEFDAKAKTLRTNLENASKSTQQKIDGIKSKWEKQDEATATKNREQLQSAIAEFQAKDFYGITISEEAAKQVYKNIRTLKFANEINSSQKNIAELALLMHFKEEIQKKASGATFGDGVKTVFDQLGQKAPRSLSQAKTGTGGNAKDLDLVSGFVS